jgi:iron complex transport system permease protein
MSAQPQAHCKVCRLGGWLLAAGVAAVLLGVGLGSDGWTAPGTLWLSDAHARIVWDIRLPRNLAAWLAGALLGLAGAVAQGVFRNPLADPYLLGSASGAALAVALSMLVWAGHPFALDWWPRLGMTGAGFVGAVLAVLFTLVLAQGAQHGLRLLLAGVIVGVVLGALTSLLALTTPGIQTTLQAYMLGSTAFVGWSANALMAAVLALGLALAVALSRVMDGLSLGEATARSLGLPVARMRLALIGVLALATGAAVAQTGLIAFVGLVAPHLVRSLVRPTHKGLVLLSALAGGLLLLLADLLARTVVAPEEWPVGVLTAILGGGYLLVLMYRSAGRGMAR